jgi:putative transposase
MPLQGSLSIERMCQLAGVSRAGFYRSLQERAPGEEDMEVRCVIQQIAVEHRRRYGYRRISAELRRRGMLVNHKRVLRILREDNLLAVQPRAFVVTTDSDHEFEVYLNLASRMKLTGMNQLWVADITYIRLKKEFVYLAVILDAFSRKVVGWALDRTLAARIASCTIRRTHAPVRMETFLRFWITGRRMLVDCACLFESGKDCKGLRAEALRVVEAKEWLR